MKVVHVHRMRGIGGSERHLLTLLPALRGARRRCALRRAGRPRRLGSAAVLRRARPAASVPYARLALGSRACRARSDAARRPPHAPRPRRRARRARPRRPRARLDEAQRRPVPHRPVPVRRAGDHAARGPRDLHHRGAAPLQRRAGRPAAGEARRRATTASTSRPRRGRPNELELPEGKLVVAVSRLVPQKGLDVAVRGDGRDRRDARRPRRGPGARAARGAGPRARRPAAPAGPRRRRGRDPPPRRRCSSTPLAGRASAWRSSRRCSAGCRSSRRASARSPRSSSTARPACSSRPTIRVALAAALQRVLADPGDARRPRPRPRPHRVLRRRDGRAHARDATRMPQQQRGKRQPRS